MKTQLSKIALIAVFGLAIAFIISCIPPTIVVYPTNSSSSIAVDNSSSSVTVPSSSSSSVEPSSSSLACTASNNTDTHYCSNGVMKQYGFVTYEGQKYKTVEIGTQTWMAENLNYNLGSNGWNNCYKDEFPNCDTYGRLYDWATAMGLPYKCNDTPSTKDIDCAIKTPHHQGICQDGWHIPSSVDWDKLYRYVDGSTGTNSPYSSPIAGKYLKSKSRWNDSGNGEDKFGFSALPGGGGFPANINYYHIGYSGFWWSATENPNGGGKHAYNQYMFSGDERASGELTYGDGVKKNLLSVRCLQD